MKFRVYGCWCGGLRNPSYHLSVQARTIQSQDLQVTEQEVSRFRAYRLLNIAFYLVSEQHRVKPHRLLRTMSSYVKIDITYWFNHKYMHKCIAGKLQHLMANRLLIMLHA